MRDSVGDELALWASCMFVYLKSLTSAEGCRSLRGGEDVSTRRGCVASAKVRVVGWAKGGAAVWMGEEAGYVRWRKFKLFPTFVRRDFAVRAFFCIFAPKCMHYEQY